MNKLCHRMLWSLSWKEKAGYVLVSYSEVKSEIISFLMYSLD